MAYGTLSVDSLLNSPAGLNINGSYVTANVNSLGTGLVPAEQFYRLNTDLAGANVTTAQNMLGVGVTLVGSTVYQFEGVFAISKSAGTTSHIPSLLFGGTATLNAGNYALTRAGSTTSFTDLSSSSTTIISSITATTAIATAQTSATVYLTTIVKGTVSVNTGGTFIPQYSLSAAPGGAYTTATGSYFKISPLSASGSNTSIGTWA